MDRVFDFWKQKERRRKGEKRRKKEGEKEEEKGETDVNFVYKTKRDTTNCTLYMRLWSSCSGREMETHIRYKQFTLNPKFNPMHNLKKYMIT